MSDGALTQDEIYEILDAVDLDGSQAGKECDGALTKQEIDALLYEDNKRNFERRKKNVLKDIEELGILDIDVTGSYLNLCAIESVIDVIKRNQEWLNENAKRKAEGLK